MAQAANDACRQQRAWSLDLEQYAKTLGCLLARGRGIHLPLPHDIVHMAAQCDPNLWEALCSQPVFRELAPPAHIAPTANFAMPGQHQAPVIEEIRIDVTQVVLGELRELIGTSNALDIDVPLMDAGLDSFAATELTFRLRSITGAEVSPTLVFEHPTVRSMAAHLSGTASEPQPMITSEVALVDSLVQGIALLGVAGRWPGSCHDVTALCPLMSAAGDAIGEVPSARWTLSAEVDAAMLSKEQVAAVQYGGFLAGADCFDNRSFGVSPAEAEAIDPQQRLLLQTGYTSLHMCGLHRVTLMKQPIGVAVGISKNDFQLLANLDKLFATGGTYLGAGSDVGMAPRRLAYVLGLNGPAFALQTACSSALVALDVAHRYHDPDKWSVSSVHMVLTPPFWAADMGGMHSITGRSYVFDARANGFARSEACISMALLPQHAALVLQATVTRQDGKGASLTAPNGLAQRLLLRAALADVAIGELAMMEAAANGSPLGDPIEIGAVTSVVPSILHVANGKGSMAHSEPSSGHSSLALLGGKLRAAQASANGQLRVLSSPVTQANQAGHLLTMQHAPLLAGKCLGTVSSFGYSGTIANAVLRLMSTVPDGRLRGVRPPHAQKAPFPWRTRQHPFLQCALSYTDGATSFRSSTSREWCAPITDHVIQGQLLFPATAHLEMGCAASRYVCLHSIAGALSRVYFMQPLVVDVFERVVECRVADGRFEVSSGELSTTTTLVDAKTHSSGLLERCETIARWTHDHADIYGRHSEHCVDLLAYYNTMDAHGANFGPSYRRLQGAWHQNHFCVGRLHMRTLQQGTAVHPADLDAGVSMRPILWSGSSSMPFSVDNVEFQAISLDKTLWTVRFLRMCAQYRPPATDIASFSCADDGAHWTRDCVRAA